MKKIFYLTVIAAFFLNLSFTQAADHKSKKSDKQATVQTKLSDAEIQVLVTRVEEIKNMDKSSLTLKEKRDLRKEVRDIKDKVNNNADGVYIGGGVLLIVIIVLLLVML